MQIRVRQFADGTTNVSVINPALVSDENDGVLQSLGLEADQEVTVTAVNAHEESDLEVSEVSPIDPANSDGRVEAPEDEQEESQGEDE